MYIFNKDILLKKTQKDLIEFLKYNTNAEIGGHRIYDGSGTHLVQSPEEIVWFLAEIKKYFKKNKINFNSFLEIGFNSGITNTLINKICNFRKIVAVDIMAGVGSTNAFFSNLRFKNIILICGDTKSKFVKNELLKHEKFNLIFIDGGHSYDVVKNDFELSVKLVTKKSIIGIHDIYSSDFDGPNKLWKQIIKSKKFKTNEYVCKKYKTKYGIGIVYL